MKAIEPFFGVVFEKVVSRFKFGLKIPKQFGPSMFNLCLFFSLRILSLNLKFLISEKPAEIIIMFFICF